MNGIKVHHKIFIHCQRLIKKTFESENIVIMKYRPLPTRNCNQAKTFQVPPPPNLIT